MNYKYERNHTSLEQEDLLLRETVFHNANGYIGVRNCFEEGYRKGLSTIRGTYINGFYDFAHMEQAEKLCGLIEEKQTILNVADTQTIRLYLEEEEFSMFEGSIEESSSTLDMEGGYTKRHVVWTSPKGKKLEITIKRMTSFVRLPLFLIEYAIKPLNFGGTVCFESVHSGEVENYYNPDDPRVAGERAQYLYPVIQKQQEDMTYLESKTGKSNLRVGTGVSHSLSQSGTTECFKQGHQFITRIYTEAEQEKEITLYKYTVFSDTVRDDNCKETVSRRMQEFKAQEPKDLYQEQKEYLAQYWKQASLEIAGDDELNLAVRYNMYQLLQSVGKDCYCNITAKGLSGEGYEGHYFWDTEMYIQPYFLLTNPQIVKNLISYRYTILEEAKENARLLGHRKGALYPWRTIMGRECSGYYPSGSAAYHINGDIAYSIIAYYLATKDLAFIEEKGMEILIETARLWMDAGNWYQGKFHIHEVTGPDEYTCMVNNNYFTNTLAKYHLYWVVKFAQMLPERLFAAKEELEEFEKAWKNMYLPYEETLGINPQDDSFLEKKVWNLAETPKENFPLLLHYHPLYLYRHQVCKQADTVLAHFILEDMQSVETMRNSYLYYEKITTHDSSLSTAIFSIMASRLGMEQKAYEYFGDSAKLDLFNTHHNTRDGIHTANMGGNYMAIVYGFGGVRIKEDGLFLSPALPRRWESYTFSMLYEGSRIKVLVTKDGCEITREEGEPVSLYVYNQKYELKDMIHVSKKYQAVIFDLDGVICHTDHYHYQAWKAVADELDIYFDETINNRLRGVSRMESFEIILERSNRTFSQEEKEIWTNKKNEIYKKLLENMTEQDLSEEVKNTLTALRVKGVKLAIGSSSKNAKMILNRLGLGDYFDAISDGNNITCSKPHPEVFQKAGEFLGIAPEYCLVVEDAAAGIQAASSAGMDSAAISDARKEESSTYGLDSFSDLVKIVK